MQICIVVICIYTFYSTSFLNGIATDPKQIRWVFLKYFILRL